MGRFDSKRLLNLVIVSGLAFGLASASGDQTRKQLVDAIDQHFLARFADLALLKECLSCHAGMKRGDPVALIMIATQKLIPDPASPPVAKASKEPQ
jgi:hypothetical protein